MKSTRVLTGIALLSILAVVSIGLFGCRQPFSASAGDQEITVTVEQAGSISITFAVPDFTASFGGASSPGSRAIAPQTASAALYLNNVEHSEIFGDLDTDTWSGTFTDVPAATYAAGTITVELRDGSGAALTRGSTGGTVTITEGGTSSVAISCVPANPTPLANFVQTPGSVAANAMEYFSFQVDSTARHKLWVMDASSDGLMMVFDADGRLIEQEQYWSGDWRQVSLYPQETGTYYLGMYGNYEYGGGATAFTVMAADDTPKLAVVYNDSPPQAQQQTYELADSSTFDLGTFDRGYPVSWDGNLRFTIYNLGGDGEIQIANFALTPDAPPLIVGQQPQTQIGWDEDFTLDLDTSANASGSADVSFDYDLVDGSGATIQSGLSYQVTLEYAVVDPQPDMQVRVEYPQSSSLEIIQDGEIWDAGSAEAGSWGALTVYLENRGNGALDVSSIALGNDAGGQLSLSDEGPFTIAGDDGNDVWLEFSAFAATGSYSVPITITSNDPTSPTFEITLQFQVTGSGTSILEYYPVTPGTLHTYDYTTTGGAFSSGTRWQTFLDSTASDRIIYTYTGPSGQNQESFIAMGVHDGYFPNGYSSSGGNDFAYFRLINLPTVVSDGATFTNNDGTQYTVVTGQSWGIYGDCIRVTFDTTGNGSVDDYERGPGSAYFARDTGLVYYQFEHAESGWWGNAGDTETYEIASAPELLSSHLITGTVEDTEGSPVGGAYASISPMFEYHSHYDVSDAGTGSFTFPMYYKAGVTIGPIYIGLDRDSNQRIDWSPEGSYEEVAIYDATDANYDLGAIAIYAAAVPPSIYSFSPSPGDTGVYIDRDIHIASSPPDVFDLTSAQAAFSIDPPVSYDMYTRYYLEQADTELTIELADLSPSTTYTVTFTTDLQLGGSPIADPWAWTFTTGTEREFDVPGALSRPAFTMTEHFPASLTFDLTWDPIAGATGYEVQQTVGESFDSWSNQWSTSDTTLPVTVGSSNQFYYRVRATDGSQYSEWSRIFYVEPQP